MEAANVEGGAKIPILGMGGALVGWLVFGDFFDFFFDF